MVPRTVLLALLLVPLAAAAPEAPEALARVDPLLAAQLLPGHPVAAIAVHEEGRTAEAVAALDALGVRHHTLPRIGVSQVLLDQGLLDDVAAIPALRALYADHALDLHLDDAAPMVGTDAAWDLGVRGAGVTVLVIDTGLDGLHPDLMDRVIANAQPHDPLESGLVPQGYVEGVPANDWFGHGTHVAGIVAGTGHGLHELDPSHGRYVGIAPEADLAGWAIPGLGSGQNVFQGLQGFEYALEKQEELNIRVINNSWGVSAPFDAGHPTNVASLAAYRAGMAVVFSAGNAGTPSGPDNIRLNMFSTAPWAVSVGAAEKDGSLAGFSSRGTDPDEGGHAWDHPTITGPGAGIMAAKSRMGAMQALGPQYAPVASWDLVGKATHYQYASGTSMSGPLVAGVLALMFSANPDLAPDQAMDLLVATASPMEYGYWQAGAGMVDAAAAVQAALETNGTRAAFLEGERRYDDPADHDNEPLKRHLFPPLTPQPRFQDVPDVEASAVWLPLLVALLGLAALRRRA